LSGGQGVAGSNPAVPTNLRVLFKVLFQSSIPLSILKIYI
jgi:hypothetical protein